MMGGGGGGGLMVGKDSLAVGVFDSQRKGSGLNAQILQSSRRHPIEQVAYPLPAPPKIHFGCVW